MKITELHAKNFGKFHNKSLILGPNINIIYGENESGKTTLHTFIRSLLFGMKRGRGRAAKYDTYNNYAPWESKGYDGTMRFECGNKQFCLQRDFMKSNQEAQLICETDGECLSVENGDLEMLLGDIGEVVYDNTVSISQLKSETNQGMVEELKTFLANTEGTGVADIYLERALQKLKKQQKGWEDVLKERNLKEDEQRKSILQKIDYLQEEIIQIEEKLQGVESRIVAYKSDKERIENEYQRAVKRVEEDREEQRRLEAQKLEQERLEQERLVHERFAQERVEQEKLEQEKLEQERRKQEKLEQERLEQVKLKQGRLEEEKLQQIRKEKDTNGQGSFSPDDQEELLENQQTKGMVIKGIAIALLCILLGGFLIENSILRFIMIAIGAIVGAASLYYGFPLLTSLKGKKGQGFMAWLRNKIKRNMPSDDVMDNQDIDQVTLDGAVDPVVSNPHGTAEETILQPDNQEQSELVMNPAVQELQAIKKEKELIVKGYSKAQGAKEQLEEQYQDKKIELENNQQEISERTNSIRLEDPIKQEIDGIMLATKVILELSKGMQSQLGGLLSKPASRILNTITNGRYKRLLIDESFNLAVDNGLTYIPAQRVSCGTLDQIYFSLRIAMAQVICEEELPIILDDAFAMYDQERLREILIWMSQQQRQFIIFTCHRREEEILEENGISYHLNYINE